MSGTLATPWLRAHLTMDDGHETAWVAVAFRSFSQWMRPRSCCGRRAALFTRWSSDANCLASCGFVDASCFAQTFC